MNEDLIKRSDAIKATWQEPRYTDPLNVLTEVRDRIEAIPSAPPKVVAQVTFDEEKLREIVKEAVERFKEEYEIEPKRGRWIPHKQDNGKTILWKCSECGQIIFSETETDRLEFHKWCSRCGADMRPKGDGDV